MILFGIKKSKKSKVEEQQTYTIKNAIKTNIQIQLIQYTEEELKKIYDKNISDKINFNVEVNDLNEENNDEEIEKIKKIETKRRKKNNRKRNYKRIIIRTRRNIKTI